MTIINPEWQTTLFHDDTVFHMTLADGQVFVAEKILRLLPQKRLVAWGEWQGKPCVAKIFFDSKRAKQHQENELKGLNILQENRIPTPQLYYQGKSKDGKAQVLIFEAILDAINLQDLWQQQKDLPDMPSLLEEVIVELATQHVLGVKQQDLHLKNFLMTEKTIYTLDAAEISQFPPLLPKKISLDHLALFLSQLGVGREDLQEKLFKHYAKARGWQLTKQDIRTIFRAIQKHHKQRWRRYAKKIFRSSSDFSCLCYQGWQGMYVKKQAQSEFLEFLHHPQLAFQHATTEYLKKGRSATVVKVTLDNRDVVVKRYNMKNNFHRIRRAFRKTRAAHAWRLAQKFDLFGIATAKPLAFIEKKWFGLRGESYYVTEYISRDHAGDYFKRYYQQKEKTDLLIKRLTALLKSIFTLGVTHGDLKITNILLDEKQFPLFIDLDGAKEHWSSLSLRRTWNKEIKRFLKNFQELPSISQQFKQEWSHNNKSHPNR